MDDILPPTDDWIFKLLFGDERNNGLCFEDIPEEIYTLELPKLPERSDGTAVWDWLQFLRAKRKEEFEMAAEKNPEIRKAVNTLYELSADDRTRAEYEMHMRAVRDKAWFEDNALQKGVQKGRQEERQKTYELVNLIKSGKSPDEAMTLLGL